MTEKAVNTNCTNVATCIEGSPPVTSSHIVAIPPGFNGWLILR